MQAQLQITESNMSWFNNIAPHLHREWMVGQFELDKVLDYIEKNSNGELEKVTKKVSIRKGLVIETKVFTYKYSEDLYSLMLNENSTKKQRNKAKWILNKYDKLVIEHDIIGRLVGDIIVLDPVNN